MISQVPKVFARALLSACAALLALAPHPALSEKTHSLAAAKPAPGGERRVALVIGNGAYKTAPLGNPVRDARAMAKVLTETGFSVTLLEDATVIGMRARYAPSATSSRAAAWACSSTPATACRCGAATT